jgi:glucose/arabinose dehydrogenase
LAVAEPASGRLIEITRILGSGIRSKVVAEGLQDPRGVARECDGGCILVAERSAGRITRIKACGTEITRETVRSDLNGPEWLAADVCGSILLTSFGDGRLLQLSSDGSDLKVVAEGLRGPKGVAVSQCGDVFVAESLTGSLIRISFDGSGKTRVAEGLLGPEMVAAGQNGMIYVAESAAGRVTEVNPQTGERRVVAVGLNGPIGVAFRHSLSSSIAPGLMVTHNDEVLHIDVQTGRSQAVARNLNGSGCAVGSVSGTHRLCFVTAECRFVDRSLALSGRVTCNGVGVPSEVQLRLIFRNRTFLGPLTTATDACGYYRFANPPFTQLMDPRVLSTGGVAQMLVIGPCGACESNVGNRCNF